MAENENKPFEKISEEIYNRIDKLKKKLYNGYLDGDNDGELSADLYLTSAEFMQISGGHVLTYEIKPSDYDYPLTWEIGDAKWISAKDVSIYPILNIHFSNNIPSGEIPSGELSGLINYKPAINVSGAYDLILNFNVPNVISNESSSDTLSTSIRLDFDIPSSTSELSGNGIRIIYSEIVNSFNASKMFYTVGLETILNDYSFVESNEKELTHQEIQNNVDNYIKENYGLENILSGNLSKELSEFFEGETIGSLLLKTNQNEYFNQVSAYCEENNIIIKKDTNISTLSSYLPKFKCYRYYTINWKIK